MDRNSSDTDDVNTDPQCTMHIDVLAYYIHDTTHLMTHMMIIAPDFRVVLEHHPRHDIKYYQMPDRRVNSRLSKKTSSKARLSNI
jgi:hypothetical protein